MSSKSAMQDGPSSKKKRTYSKMSRDSRSIIKSGTRSSIPRALKEYTFTRKFLFGNLNMGTGTGFSLAYSFTIQDLPGYTEFAQLFDSYRINLVTVRYDWSKNDASSAGGIVNAPMMYNVIDKDDDTALGTLSEALQYGNCIVHNFGQNPTFQRSFVPCIASATYRSAVTTAYSRKSRQWLDFSTTDVPHYGIKYWVAIAGTPALDLGSIQQCVTVNFSCKDTR